MDVVEVTRCGKARPCSNLDQGFFSSGDSIQGHGADERGVWLPQRIRCQVGVRAMW